jgi:hypothetical protein
MSEPIIFILDDSNGFFCLFFLMCNAYIASKKLGHRFYLKSSQWKYKHTEGWHDYFTTLEKPPLFPIILNPIYANCSLDRFYKPDHSLQEYAIAIHELFRLKPNLVSRVNALVSSMSSDYIAVFVRRGDKLIQEAKYIPFSDILKCIPHSETSTFFIQTDDYRVIEEAKSLLPKASIFSTVSQNKLGSFHTIKRSRQQICEETEEMLVGLSVCLRSFSCWTDDTSNVGRFLKLSNPRVHIYPKDYDVDLSTIVCPSWGFVKRSP